MSRDYDLRSLQHERRMLGAYRKRASVDASLLQPLANACWRASAFEWVLYRDAETVRRLWGEGALALSQGFARRQTGFHRSPDQLILALYLSIAAREREAFNTLALIDANLRTGVLREARAFRHSRAHFHLSEGFLLVARALVEKRVASARAAAQSLQAAREENDRGWWERQFPNALEAAWLWSEHEAVCVLLAAVAERIADEPAKTEAGGAEGANAELLAADFASVIDDTLLRLERFIENDSNHHPKLYIWLPGIALCALATSARLPMDWLTERCENKATGYTRLPLELLRNPSTQ